MAMTMAARAEPVGMTGLQDLIWPAVVVMSPFMQLHRLVFGWDEDAIAKTQKQAHLQLQQLRGGFDTNGLYTGPIDISSAVHGMLVLAKLPWVEVDVAGSKWLFNHMEDQATWLAQVSPERPYIRLELAASGDPACPRFISLHHQLRWDSSPPAKPGTCLKLSFVAALASDLGLTVDTQHASQRELRWVLKRLSSNETLLSLPFWQRQTSGQPLRIFGSYRAAHDSSQFADLIRTLRPGLRATDSQGRPFALERGQPIIFDTSIPPYPTTGHVEPLTARNKESWNAQVNWHTAYQAGIDTAHPSQIDRQRLFLPVTQEIREVKTEEGQYWLAEKQKLLLTMTSPPRIKGWLLRGVDLERNLQWAMQVDTQNATQLAAHCGVPEGFWMAKYIRAIELEGVDETGIAFSGNFRFENERPCLVRIRIPWPTQPRTDETSAAR
jgi:hypothetical protein